jgi:uncharacterized membrane protein
MTRITPQTAEPPPPSGPVYLDARLWPNRSLSVRGFQIVMLALAAASFVAGLVFLSMGAWPVVGFFGLDILLVWLAFRASYRAGRREKEEVRVTAERIDVARHDPRGGVRRWTLSPYFAKVDLAEPEDSHPEVSLRAGPDSLPLATCLAPEERRSFAGALQQAIDAARRERHPLSSEA